MSVMVLDAGNSIIKAKIARRKNGETAFPHAMKQLTESEYEKITNRSGIQNQSKDYLRINGKPHVIGDNAERHGLVTQRTGTARYTRDYYGLFAAAALGVAFFTAAFFTAVFFFGFGGAIATTVFLLRVFP